MQETGRVGTGKPSGDLEVRDFLLKAVRWLMPATVDIGSKRKYYKCSIAETKHQINNIMNVHIVTWHQ